MITIKCLDLPKPSNSTSEDISTTPFTGKTSPQLEEVEDNTLEKIHLLHNKLSNNLAHTKHFKRNFQRRLFQFKDQDGDGSPGITFPSHSESLTLPIKKCWLLKDWPHYWVNFCFIAAIDVWEHAYYVDYKNVRADYVKQIWKIVNWKDVEKRFLSVAPKKWSWLNIFSFIFKLWLFMFFFDYFNFSVLKRFLYVEMRILDVVIKILGNKKHYNRKLTTIFKLFHDEA